MRGISLVLGGFSQDTDIQTIPTPVMSKLAGWQKLTAWHWH